MHPVMRLYEDVLSNAGTFEFRLPPLPRFIFVVHGAAAVGGRMVKAGEAWQGERDVMVRPGPEGACCWRWELSRGDAGATVAGAPGMVTHEKLTAFLETMPKGDLLMRGDSVAFPPGGCAFRHVHQGPGIRCLIEGGIRIDVHERSTAYGPGSAWYEAGPEPVFAQGADDKPSRFVRVMILPRALIGKSSIRYVDETDKDRPKTQSYKVYADAPIEFEGWK
jgi:hypothetical protein